VSNADTILACQWLEVLVMNSVPRFARPEVYVDSPAIGWYTDHVLYNEVWNRDALSKRDRSLLTLGALIALGQAAQVSGHTRRALNNGVEPLELLEVVLHCAFYCGWPRVMTAAPVMAEALRGQGLDPSEMSQVDGPQLDGGVAVADDLSAEDGSQTYLSVVEAYREKVLNGDVCRRDGLKVRDRALVTLAVLVATGRLDELVAAVAVCLEQGLSSREVAEGLGHLAFYVGFPAASAAGRLLDKNRN
jgi:4-carboxymuconolactone decarboxylase